MTKISPPISDSALVQGLIPQKAPFVMVDRLVSFSDNQVIAGLEIKAENLLCDGGRFSAAGLIEHMAQTIALHTGYEFYAKGQPAPTGYIGAIKNVEIFNRPLVGDVIITEANLTHRFMDITMVEAEVRSGDKVLARCNMKTVLVQT